MSEQDKIQLFEDQPIRTAWDEEQEEWFFSVVDVVGVLTEQTTLRRQHILGCAEKPAQKGRRGPVAYKL